MTNFEYFCNGANEAEVMEFDWRAAQAQREYAAQLECERQLMEAYDAAQEQAAWDELLNGRP